MTQLLGSASKCFIVQDSWAFLSVEQIGFMKWTSEVASSSTVHMTSLEEGLGRVMYVAGALE